jgi:hypothetical protein
MQSLHRTLPLRGNVHSVFGPSTRLTARMWVIFLFFWMRLPVPFRFHVTSVDGIWKLGHNKRKAVHIAVAEQMAQHHIKAQPEQIAAMMRKRDRSRRWLRRGAFRY